MRDRFLRHIMLVAVGVVIAGCCCSVHAATLAHWLFDDGSGPFAVDEGGFYTGALSPGFVDTSAGAGQYEGGSGWTTGGLNFDGYSSANSVDGGGVVTTQLPVSMMARTSFTLEFVASHTSPYMDKWSPFFNADTACCWFFGKAHGTYPWTGNENITPALHFNFAGIGGGYSVPVPEAFDGNPHHFACVFDDVNDTLDLYLDHQNVGAFVNVTGTLDFPGNVVLGGSYWVFPAPPDTPGWGERWSGVAYEARITVDEALGPVDFLPVPAPTVPAPTPQPSSFAYADFSDPSDFRARGSASPINDRLRLTSVMDFGQSGAYWLNGAVDFVPDLSFNTKFAFEITEEICGGADILSFVIQNAGPDAIGLGGGSIGLELLGGDYLAVELDTWYGGLHDGTNPDNWNHIAIDLSGVDLSIAETGVGVVPEFLNAGVLHAWVDYNGATDLMEVYFSNADVKPGAPVLSAIVDLESHFGNSDLYVGFVGTTGGCLENHDVVSWEFQSIPEPSSLVLALLAVAGLLGYARWRRK